MDSASFPTLAEEKNSPQPGAYGIDDNIGSDKSKWNMDSKPFRVPMSLTPASAVPASVKRKRDEMALRSCTDST